MRKRGLAAIVLLFFTAAFAACAVADAAAAPESAPARPESAVSASVAAAAAGPPAEEDAAALAAGSEAAPAAPCFFKRVAGEAVAALGLTGKEKDVEKIKLAYRYVIARTTYIEYDQPELVDGWRYADHCGQTPSCYQVMGAGPLLYGIGTCENYAAALMLMLHEMGYEAVYVPGLTYSVFGTLVDHAWVMVRLAGTWYHIDPQLEDNVMKGAHIGYRYFLKGDEEMAAHHVWGGKLPRPDDYSLRLPRCPNSMPAQNGETLEQDPEPRVAELVARAAQAQAAHSGPVSKLEPEALPPLPGEMWPEEDAVGE